MRKCEITGFTPILLEILQASIRQNLFPKNLSIFERLVVPPKKVLRMVWVGVMMIALVASKSCQVV